LQLLVMVKIRVTWPQRVCAERGLELTGRGGRSMRGHPVLALEHAS
jgi:hypothetical protein